MTARDWPWLFPISPFLDCQSGCWRREAEGRLTRDVNADVQPSGLRLYPGHTTNYYVLRPLARSRPPAAAFSVSEQEARPSNDPLSACSSIHHQETHILLALHGRRNVRTIFSASRPDTNVVSHDCTKHNLRGTVSFAAMLLLHVARRDDVWR